MHRDRHHPIALAAAVVAVSAAGCAGGGGSEVSVPAGPVGIPTPLAYGVPEPNPATYAIGDTARFVIESGAMGTMRVLVAHSGTAELDFRPEGGGWRVAVRFASLAATFRNPGQGEANADQREIGGPIGLRLEPGGRIEVVDTPSLGPRLRRIAGSEALVRSLFVRLPARAVEPGDRWVDTVTTREDSDGTHSTARSIITSTLVGDTVMAGRRALFITTTAETRVEVTGTSGGVEIDQRMSGTIRGTVVWDDVRNVLVARRETGELDGTLDLPGMAVGGLPVRGSIRRVVNLQP